MRTLPSNASFYQIRKFAAGAEKSFAGFAGALDRFGREPGEGWHAIADEFNNCLSELRQLLAGSQGKTSLPGAERKELHARVAALAAKLAELAGALRVAVLDACPPAVKLAPPDRAAAKAWQDYEKVMVRIMDRVLEREAVQRLMRRAHDPASVIPLVCAPPDIFAGLPRVWEFASALQDLARHTPLPHFGGLTLLAAMRKKFLGGIELNKAAPSEVFLRFVAGIASGVPERRNAARKELEALRNASNDERRSRAAADNFSKSNELWGVWLGVKAALAEPDSVRRRAALCALPFMRSSFIDHDFPEECVGYIVAGLRNEDGVVRYRALRFAADFVMVYRNEEPEIIVFLQTALKRSLAENKKEAAFSASAKKLMKEILWFRNYDENRGVEPGY